MDFDQISKDLGLLWQAQLAVIVLLALGFLIFVFLVVDVWRHKRRKKGPRLH